MRCSVCGRFMKGLRELPSTGEPPGYWLSSTFPWGPFQCTNVECAIPNGRGFSFHVEFRPVNFGWSFRPGRIMPRYDFVCILPCRKDGEPEEITMAVEDYDRLRVVLKCKICGKALKRVMSPVVLPPRKELK